MSEEGAQTRIRSFDTVLETLHIYTFNYLVSDMLLLVFLSYQIELNAAPKHHNKHDRLPTPPPFCHHGNE